MKTIYIAGPMTGYPEFNYPAFHEAEKRLTWEGWAVYNPANNFGGDTTLPYGVYLREAISMLLKCEAIVLLPGWPDSRGATLERDVAVACDMDVYHWVGGKLNVDEFVAVLRKYQGEPHDRETSSKEDH